MDKIFHNQKGFTLLEVLLSIVLLSIVLTSFFGFFTQSAIFASKNENKLSTSQEAQKIINSIEVNLDAAKASSLIGKTNINPTLKSHNVEMDDTKYTVTVTFEEKEVEVGTVKTKFIQANVVVKDGSSESETFTFIR